MFIKRRLKCEHYIRYVDDFILLDISKERLKYFRDKIRNFLEKNLSLRLSESKTKIQAIDKGIDFLGYFIKPLYALVRRKVVGRFKNKLSEFKRKPVSNNDTLAIINSYYGHFRHAASFRLREDIYKNHLGNLRDKFELAERSEFMKVCRE
jgi:RNA-directed DNA polymerase